MRFHRTIATVMLSYTILLSSCQKQQSSNQETTTHIDGKITQKDTVELIQNVLNHKQLDSLLNFAFKDQTLKIVRNNVIKKPLNLIMNGKLVEFREIDCSSRKLSVYNRPKFFAKVTVLEITTSGVRLVIFFESIGLFGEYWLKKDQKGLWKIENVNFAHT